MKGYTGNQQVPPISLATSPLTFKPCDSAVSGCWGHQLVLGTGSFQLPLLQGNPKPRKNAGLSKALAVVPFFILPVGYIQFYGLMLAPDLLNTMMQRRQKSCRERKIWIEILLDPLPWQTT